MKVMKTLISISFMIVCFFMSWLFFMNSGILTDDFRMNEIRLVKVLRALDEIPLTNFDSDEIEFRMWGVVESINGNEIIVKDYYKTKTFYLENTSGIETEDNVFIVYSYDENYSTTIGRFKKILKVDDVMDYESCVEYGGEINYDFPRNCTIGQVTFTESLEELKNKCESFDGIWIKGFNECEGISENNCYSLDGNYFECESSCRNDPDAEICIMMCVQVCKFD